MALAGIVPLEAPESGDSCKLAVLPFGRVLCTRMAHHGFDRKPCAIGALGFDFIPTASIVARGVRIGTSWHIGRIGCFNERRPITISPELRSIAKWSELNPGLHWRAWERYLTSVGSQNEIISGLLETVRLMKDVGVKRIVVFGPGPLWTTTLPIDLFRFMVRTRASHIPERLGRVPDSLWRLDAAMRALASAENIQYVSVLDDFCDKDGCQVVGDKSLQRPDLLYRDKDHLTLTGSQLLISLSTDQLVGEN